MLRNYGDRRSVGWVDKEKLNIPLELVSTDNEVYESDRRSYSIFIKCDLLSDFSCIKKRSFWISAITVPNSSFIKRDRGSYSGFIKSDDL